eukprot:g857.t1
METGNGGDTPMEEAEQKEQKEQKEQQEQQERKEQKRHTKHAQHAEQQEQQEQKAKIAMLERARSRVAEQLARAEELLRGMPEKNHLGRRSHKYC